MSKPSMISTVPTTNEAIKGYVHWCDGCKTAHRIVVRRNGVGPVHRFNGDYVRPSFTPNLRFVSGREQDGSLKECHFVLEDGNIRYLNDSYHRLKGKTVPLPAFPDTYLDETELEYVVSFAH